MAWTPEMMLESACAALVASAWVRYDLRVAFHVLEQKRPPTRDEAEAFLRDAFAYVLRFVPTRSNPVHVLLGKYLQNEGMERIDALCRVGEVKN
jgi:hypothetical protein